MKKNPKSKRGPAERAAEWYAREILNCKDGCRSVRTQWQRQDLFACDFLGKKADVVICNNGRLEKSILSKYEKEGSFPVEIDIKDKWGKRRVIIDDYLADTNLARHHSGKLAQTIVAL